MMGSNLYYHYNPDIRLSRDFHGSEFACPHCGEIHMVRAFIINLQIARGYAGTPFIITEGGGWRCPYYNTAIGGAKKSNHMSGDGVDIRAVSPIRRWKIYEGLRKAGFVRIIIYPRHIHVDSSLTKPGFYLGYGRY